MMIMAPDSITCVWVQPSQAKLSSAQHAVSSEQSTLSTDKQSKVRTSRLAAHVVGVAWPSGPQSRREREGEMRDACMAMAWNGIKCS